MKILEEIKPYQNRLIGAILGLLVAILILVIGFWETVLIVLITAVGYGIGKMRDEDEDFYSLFESLRSLLDR